MSSKLQILSKLKAFLFNKTVQSSFISYSSAFSRSPILDFSHTVLFILSLPKLSLSVSLDRFLETCFGIEAPCLHKSSLSKARYKIQGRFFSALFTQLVELVYQLLPLQRWQGHLVFGVDGSQLSLPSSSEIAQKYGTHINQSGSWPMARCLVCYDVLNRFCVKAALVPIRVSELAIAYAWTGRYQQSGIYLFDRGFASFVHFWLLARYQRQYVIRCKVGFNKEVRAFVASGVSSQLVTMSMTKNACQWFKKKGIQLAPTTSVRVRLVRVELADGTIEVLVTNLLEEDRYPNNSFKELYFKRWRCEVFFDELKNQLQLQCFIGKKPAAIEQEFYASLFVYNLHGVLLVDAQQEVQEKYAKSTSAVQRQVNRNVSLGFLLDKLVVLLKATEVEKILQRLHLKFCKNTVPIKPDRKNPRKRKRKSPDKWKTEANLARAA